jgi:hypothetical protein
MIELKRDMMRQMELRNASRDVALNGHCVPDQTLIERRDAMRAQMTKPKRRIKVPWLTIIMVASCIPFFMGDGGEKMMAQTMQGLNPEMASKMKDPSIANMLGKENAKVSISMGGQTFEKEITAQDVRAVQSKL